MFVSVFVVLIWKRGQECVCVCVFRSKCMHMCMKGTEEAAVTRRRNLFEKSLPWPGLISSLHSSVGVVHLYVCVCVRACACSVWGICKSFQRLSPQRTGLHSHQWLTALTWLTAWSSFQPRNSPPATSKYRAAEESYLPWDDRGEAAPATLFPSKCWTAGLTLRLSKLSACCLSTQYCVD